MRGRLLAVGGAVSAAAIIAAQGAAQPRTTSPPKMVEIKITMTDSAFQVSPKAAPRAAYGHFYLANRGTKPHAFTFGSIKPRSGTQAGFTKTLRPGTRAEVYLFLDYRGAVAYRGSLPADRAKTRMKGVFRIY